MTKTVATLIGSLRKDSLNRKLGKALEKLAEGQLVFHDLDIGALPHYNDDLWVDVPACIQTFKRDIERADAILAIVPEYNRSYPGVVKNALDWASRPKGQNVCSNKPAAVVGTSPGAIGTAVGQAHMRLSLINNNMIVMHQPEVYLQWHPEAFAEDGTITDDSTRSFLQSFIDAFAKFIAKHG